ncbi:MAG: ankyrin repeat domain-containing protein [Rugosibacter sp.]
MKTGLAVFLLLAASLTWAAGLPDRVAFSVAIERGDMAQARAWLEEGLPADFAGDVLGSGLMIAAWEGNLPMMALFLEHGADVNQANAHGETALLLAAWKGRVDAVRWLLARGAQANRPGKQWSALHYAAFAGHADIVSYLLAQGADANTLSPNGSTPLMMAAREGQTAIAGQLLAAGARGAMVNDNGENAVLWAMRNNNLDIAKAIAGSKDFSALAERPAESWGRAVRSQPVPDRADQLLAQARKMEAAGRPDVALKYYRSALLAIRTAERAAGKTATPRAVTGLVISAQRGNPAAQTAGLRYATPAAGNPVTGDANDPAEALLRRARELEASGRRGEALQAYRQAAALLRNAQTP